MPTDYLQTPLQYLKGVGPKRAADLQRVGLVTVEDFLYRFPLRYEDRGQLQPIASLKPGQQVAIAGRIQSSRSAHNPPSRIQDLRSAHRRCDRIDRRDLDEPVVPERHPSARCAGRALRHGRGAAGAADHESRLRSHRRRRGWRRIRRGRADDSHRPHRAGVRKSRRDDAEDAAAPRLRCAVEPAGRTGRSLSRRRPATPESARPPRGADGHAFPRRGHAGRSAERFQNTGAGAAHLRRVLPVSARA